MKKLTVDLGDRSYPILIGEGIIQREQLYRKYIAHRHYLIVTNRTLYDLYQDDLLAMAKGEHEWILVLEDGEQYKNRESLFAILTRLLELEANRKSLLVAFGGGVIGDLVGFAASIYQRGIDFIQIPTSLLAQVDSSVGGKTAINHELGKNMIGSFYQPQAVLIDPTLLKTLPKREYISGLAEVVKYGFIQDYEYLTWLVEHVDSILSLDYETVGELIYRSCAAKSHIVHLDEEESGIRATLNLGHTFGHAIERAYGYQGILHGEAVAIGINMAAELSLKLGYLTEEEREYVSDVLRRFQLPLRSERYFPTNELLATMRLDKKNMDGDIRFVLFESIGKALIRGGVDEALIKMAIETGM